MGLATACWAWFQPDWGVPCQITIGTPRVGYPVVDDLRGLCAPWCLFKGGRWSDEPEQDQRRHYRHQLHTRGPRILAALDELRACYPGERLVLLCFEPPWGVCHRFWLAQWLTEKLDVQVPELVPADVLQSLGSPLDLR